MSGRTATVAAPAGRRTRAPITAARLRAPGELLALWLPLLLLLPVLALPQALVVGLVGVAVSALMVMVQQKRLLGAGVRVGGTQFSRYGALAMAAALRLDMRPPEVFVTQSPAMNAFALGLGPRGTVVLHTGLLEALDDREALFVLGHEFGHLKCGHARLLLLRGLPSMRTGPFAAVQVLAHLLLLRWQRRAEFTADRAGLVACRDIRAAVGTMLKLAVGPQLAGQVDLEALLAQHGRLRRDRLARLSAALATHPHLLDRIAALIDFHGSAEWRAIEAGA
jgi:Zn-dependent protease with chaperone function